MGYLACLDMTTNPLKYKLLDLYVELLMSSSYFFEYLTWWLCCC